MRGFKKLVLTTTAIATLATAVSANIYTGQLTSYSDQQVLTYLVREHARDPSTFEDAHEYILLNRPAIMEDYLRRTLDRAPDTRSTPSSEPSVGETSGIGSVFVLGVVGIAAAASLAGGDGPGASGPQPPSPSPSPNPNPTPINPSPSPPPDPITDPDSDLNDPAYYQTPEFEENYGLALIGAHERYAKGGQGQGVKISILDTGIDFNHPDFRDKIDPEFRDKIDFDSSHSYFSDPDDIYDTDGHGTHVAGIAAGWRDGVGTHGVAFQSELVIFKGISGIGTGSSTLNVTEIWIDAINRSIDAGVHVMNNSWGYIYENGDGVPITAFNDLAELDRAFDFSFGDGALEDLIAALDAAKAANLISVISAGNDGLANVGLNAGLPVLLPDDYPDDYEDYFIAVVAVYEDVNERVKIAGFSNRCGVARNFCLAAPGVGIVSANNGGGLAIGSGTSQAAPHVAGGYALLKSQWPETPATEIVDIMFATADDLGDPGVDPIYGQGLLNLERAMRPIGEVVVYQGTTTESDAMPLAETGIVASGALAPALNQALAGQVLMVADAYTRGFEFAASALVSETAAPDPRPTFVSEVQASDTLTLMRSDHGAGIRVDGDVSSYEISLGAIDPDADPFGQLLTEDYAVGHDVQLTDALALTTDHAFGSAADTFSRTSIGLEAKDGDGSGFSAQVGRIEEHGTVLGSRFMGAAGQDGRSATSFLTMSGSVAFGQDTLLTVSGTQSRTDFQQSGLVTGGENLMGRAGSVSISQAQFLGSPGTMRLSVSSPLQISSGEISIDLPQDRVAAVAGQESTGVTRTSQTVEITSSERPIDIGLTYQIASDAPGPDMLFSAGYRAQGGDPNPYIG
ncbi:MULTISPECIES: S8 family peptidase, partial [unclassified Roseobacter]|uniref:S8 family peptidase n=5 Tax=Roseobacter TaxID=2433 RepID=UPI00149091A8